MSDDQRHETGPGRSLDRARRERALKRAARHESWLEQLQRIAEQAKGHPQSRD
jgi:hypothetical protein